MEITLEMVDQVHERAGVSYEKAKAALEAANGSVLDAIIAVEKSYEEESSNMLEKIKELIKKGNVTRIRVLRGDAELVNIPVTAGVAGGVLGLVLGPGALISATIAGAVAKFGFNCRFQLVKEDGSVEEVFPNKETPADTVEEVAAPAEPEASEKPESPVKSVEPEKPVEPVQPTEPDKPETKE